MPVAAWIALLGIVVGTVVTLSVAYMQRKQMRQAELHRVDPSVSLVPPPHPITHFIKGYWYFLVFGGFDLAMLIRDLGQTTPITRRVVFDITLDTISLVLMVLLGIVTAILRMAARTIGVLEKMTDIMGILTKEAVDKRGSVPPSVSPR